MRSSCFGPDHVSHRNNKYHWLPNNKKLPTAGPPTPVGDEANRARGEVGPEQNRRESAKGERPAAERNDPGACLQATKVLAQLGARRRNATGLKGIGECRRYPHSPPPSARCRLRPPPQVHP